MESCLKRWLLTFIREIIIMNTSQLSYYNSLSEENKKILQAAALSVNFSINSDLQDVIYHFLHKKITQKEIKSIIQDAVERGLFSITSDWRGNYTVSPVFLVFVFPEINIDARALKSICEDDDNDRYYGFYHISFAIKTFRNCLYLLLYAPASEKYKYVEYEKKLQRYIQGKILEYYGPVIEDERYEKVLGQISEEIIYNAVILLVNNAVNNLVPQSDTFVKIERLEKLTGYPLIQASQVEFSQIYWSGNLEKAIETDSGIILFKAVKSLIDGNIEVSVSFFNKLIKEQHKSGNKSPLPSRGDVAYFYILALLFSDSSVAVPVFQKTLQWTSKNNFGFYSPFIAVILDARNEQKSKLPEMKSLLSYQILYSEIDLSSVLNMLIYYLLGEKIEEGKASHIYDIIKKAVDAGYQLLAYEAAFVAKAWFDENRFDDLYGDLSGKMSYEPVISRIHRQEDWEKSLNLLLGMKSKSGSKTKETNESSTRVVYYFNPKNNNIQPVLQTRQVKGWSKGRNIAMKTFQGAGVNGMTDQDIRISKHVKVYGDYYDTYYDFSDKIFIDLIGHPYIFLENTSDIPVEFVAAQLIVSVNKTSKGYQLVSDIKSAEKSIFVEKETNTRYKVYNLTANQMRIIEIINEQKVTVPESGKNKLTELLGTLSAEGMTVHSDLVADKNTHTEVKELPADSRVRVQLLPWGDGLKTELFSKPFGERPPYCKPGKGGKVLISNEENVQLQVKRNLKQETEYEQILLNDIQSLESLDENEGLMSFDDPIDSLYLLDILAKRQDVCVVEWPEGEKYRLRGTANINNLNINIKSGTNWFDLQGELRVDENTVLTLQQLLKLTAKSHGRFIELSQGEFLALSDRLKKQLDNLRLFSDEDKKGIHLNKFASVGLGDFFDEMENVKADKAWKTFRQQVEKTKDENAPVPANLQAELRAYQEDGFRWMARLAEWNGGACLADDMGLGKTVQTLAILLHRAQQGAALVVCPVSVIGNWASEAAKFAPTLCIKTLGINSANRKETLQSLEAGDVLITSYGLLQSEEKLFAGSEFATVVLDEAHVIKNYATKTSKATMQLKAGFRVALTGTPLQNHLGEIWNLFNFINPGLLGSLQHFNDAFVKSGDEQSKKHLKKMIAPFILRRTKTAVLDELPPKTEIVKKIQLSGDEMAFYEALRRQALENLSNADESKHIQVLAEITKLRQASCNPLLIDASVNIPSSKLATFLDITGELIANNHRALVFSQFVSHLAIVRKELDKQGIKYKYIDGSTSQAERQRNVKEFQSGEGELFLISLKAGGLGLNLTAADYVIHLDPWWNPAIEDQASDRAHRIGQQRPVTIYRLVAENTIEEKIIQLHTHKRDLAEQLLEGSDMAARLSVSEMVDLIREGAITGR